MSDREEPLTASSVLAGLAHRRDALGAPVASPGPRTGATPTPPRPTPTSSPQTFVSAAQAGRMKGVSRQTVVKAIQAGKIRGQSGPGQGWQVDVASLALWTPQITKRWSVSDGQIGLEDMSVADPTYAHHPVTKSSDYSPSVKTAAAEEDPFGENLGTPALSATTQQMTEQERTRLAARLTPTTSEREGNPPGRHELSGNAGAPDFSPPSPTPTEQPQPSPQSVPSSSLHPGPDGSAMSADVFALYRENDRLRRQRDALARVVTELTAGLTA